MSANLVISGGGAFQPNKSDTNRMIKHGISHIYTSSSGFTLSHDEYQHLKASFIAFCQKNKKSTCPMLMFTGLHGEYQPATSHNLNEAQVDELVWIARSHQIQFQHIYFDNCCAAFGMSKFMTLLTVGGQAYGDRLTSQGYFFQHELNQQLLKQQPLNYIEIAQKGLQHRSSPIVIKRQSSGQDFQAVGEEQNSAIQRISKKMMSMFGCQTANELLALGDVFNVNEIKQDFFASRQLLASISHQPFDALINNIAPPIEEQLNSKVFQIFNDLNSIQQSLDYLKESLPEADEVNLSQWQTLGQSLTSLLAVIQESSEVSNQHIGIPLPTPPTIST